MMKRHAIRICVFLGAVAVAPNLFGEATNPKHLDLRDGHRQLFLDDLLLEKVENVHKEPGKVTKNPDNPVIKRDKPWDASRTDLYGSVVYDPENQRLQLFYSANNVPNGHEDRLAYAESRDGGKTWVKPEFDHIPYKEHQRTNLVMLPPSQVMHGACVFRDKHETDPSKRYKLFTASYPDSAYLGIPGFYDYGGTHILATDNFDPNHPKLPPGCKLPGMYVAYSPDGIHWTCAEDRFSPLLSDTAQCAFWDERIGKYVAYVRARTKNDRSVARMESKDFENWSEPTVVLEGTPAQCLYSMGVVPYEGIYIGTPWIFDRGSEGRGGPVIWPELAVSRDGIHWKRLFPGKPLIPTGPKGSPDSRQIRLASSWVVVGDEILFCYGQTDKPHTTVDMQIDIGTATMRRDGFAAMVAGETEGSILTKPLQFQAGRLCINAVTEPDGFVKAELVDSANRPLAGYELKSCRALTGDLLDGEVVWDGKTKVPEASGDGCRIRFVLKNARLYSFWIAEQ